MKTDRIKKRFLISLICISTLGIIFYLSYVKYPRKPNVILITIDALRADHLGCYGYKRNTSPHIDRLAKEGVMFTQAIAQSSHTPASIGSILTSAMPNKHLLNSWGYTLNYNLPTITNILRTNGYLTIFIGNKNFSHGLHGFAKGFSIIYDGGGDANIVTNKALEYLIKYINKPLFLWIHYMDAHSPYNPVEPYNTLYINDELYDKQKKLPIVEDVPEGYGYQGIPQSLAENKQRVDNPDYYIAEYDGAIRAIDTQIGVILNRLKQLRLDKKTLIIIISDHGEMLGEHDYYFHHGYFLYEPLIRIPLIIKFDKIIPQNKVVNIQISAHLDILPTILDVLGINRAKILQGNSLLPIILGKTKSYPSYVFADEAYTVRCIRTSEWKLIYTERNNKEYELYNLKNDPRELNNLVFLKREQFEFLRQKLDDFIKQTNLQDYNISKPTLDQETKDRLESLGYAQ